MAEYPAISNDMHWTTFFLRYAGRPVASLWLLLLPGAALFIASCHQDSEPIKESSKLNQLEAHISEWEKTFWHGELIARNLDSHINQLWGRIRNKKTDPLALSGLPDFDSIALPAWEFRPIGKSPWLESVSTSQPSGNPSIPRAALLEIFRSHESAGWSLVWSEWRLTDFSIGKGIDKMATGRIATRLHLEKKEDGQQSESSRMAVTGDMITRWRHTPDQTSSPWQLIDIDAQALRAVKGLGPAPYQSSLSRSIPPVEETGFIDPMVLRDLNNDGFVDIILLSRNLIFRNRGDGSFDTGRLHEAEGPPCLNGLIADINSDGLPDFVGLGRDGLQCLEGRQGGTFGDRWIPVWSAPTPVLNPLAMSVADIDRDGDLDLWIGQYKIPFYMGQMPTPFYDANDGFPSYLLMNNERGRSFTVIEDPHLQARSNRRNYAAGLIDLNQDGYPDLITSNDFAGLDIFLNNHSGSWTDISRNILDTPHLFSMGMDICDWNGDGRLDIFAAGMKSHVASRIISSSGFPQSEPNCNERAADMNFGNRLFLTSGQPDHNNMAGLRSDSRFSRDVSDAGWAWGIAAPDFDLDGFPELFVTNGHKSRFNSYDYDNQFWTCDLFLATSDENPVLNRYFSAKSQELRQKNQSYGGHFANRFFYNLSGTGAVEVGWIAGLAAPHDSRNAAFTDIDNDGDHDIIEIAEPSWNLKSHTLKVYRRLGTPSSRWIAFNLRNRTGYPIPFGATLQVKAGDRILARTILSSNSYRCQPDPVIRCGLGNHEGTVSLTVFGADGQTHTFTDLEAGQMHTLLLPQPPGDK